MGIIGTGTISRFHMEAYRKLDNVQVIAACDINEERVGEFAREYNIPNVFTKYEDLLDMKEINAVSVTTWNVYHCPISIAALKAGKNVLCEKPLAMNSGEAEMMVKTAGETGRILMVGFCTRYESPVVVLKDMIDRGDLGRIYYAKTSFIRRWGNPGGWFADVGKSGGGPVIDLGVHALDIVRYLSGKPNAVAVSASVYNLIGRKPEIKGMGKYNPADSSGSDDVEDSAAAFIKFDNGMSLSFETSWVQNIKEDSFRVELYGDKAGAQLYPVLEIYEDRHDYLTQVNPVYTDYSKNGQFVFDEEIEHFTGSVSEGTECTCPGADGLEVMRIVDAIYESAKTGKEIYITR